MLNEIILANLKGLRISYCLYAKPFNLATCFVQNVRKCYDHMHQKVGPWTALCNNV